MKFQRPKGTRDFLPDEMIKREYVINTIKNVFVAYGFDALETPVFEDWKLLAAKCGEDIKEQIFRFKDKADRELGLRFDLTVPMCRVVANNPQLPKPFKRYAIAPVWRYEEITAGRKREFYQCDIDIVGSSSMEADVECIAAAVDCFKKLGFKKFRIKINNRKVLEGFLQLIKKRIEIETALEFSSLEVFRAIDKLNKIGLDGVKRELKKIGMGEEQINELLKVITIKGSYKDVLEKGKKLLKGIAVAEEGIRELEEIFKFSKIYGISDLLVLDFTLARGIDYYTGPIFEIEVETEKNIGSVAGGGRYDNLIELLGGRPTPATGISLGIERIIEIMKEKKMFDLPETKVKVFVAAVNEKVKEDAIKIAQKLRKENISCQIDLMNRSLTKQLEFADSLGVPYVVVVGKKELDKNVVKIRNMKKREEKEIKIDELVDFLTRLFSSKNSRVESS
jgi:histidyl-tRNA synthetase